MAVWPTHRYFEEVWAVDQEPEMGPDALEGEEPWQKAMSATVRRWMTRVGADRRIPPEYGRARRQRPDLAILREPGFQLAGSYRFPAACEWTPETLTGFVFSTPVLSREALGDLAPGFEEDLRRELRACAPARPLRQVIGFGYELARRRPSPCRGSPPSGG